ncbi:Hexokinase-2, chloroplastic [Glycine soja]|uniref:Phosphotransferase n=1 Tax=Glycine soja TaxID=3848 RepID=A0A445J107_GLYSO|nr:Hexokinase-2, chloroplastic [Glycine soja]
MWPVKIGVESTEKWLDGHNRRRRKPQPSSLFMAAEKFMYNYKGRIRTLVKIISNFYSKLNSKAGRDVVACLNEAMERQGIDMRLSALVNDTVALLAGVEYWDNGVVVARTNACYVEQISAIPKLQGHVSSSGQMVNKHLSPSTDWGAFSNGLPLTKINREMDVATINLGDEQIFEKTISGMYLGEIVRQVLLEMAEEGCLFGKCVPQKLSTPLILR